jgi:hypothetical protein
MEYTDEQFERFIKGEISEDTLLGKREEGKFYVGDRVRCKITYDGRPHVGAKGTVLLEGSGKYGSIGVRWDERMGGHNLSRNCEEGRGWYIPPSNLELIK